MRTRTITRSWTREDRAENIWPVVEFDIAPGDATLEVRLDYDLTRGVVDLGCTGPPDGAGGSGWRGWSGGARSRFVITKDDATPGYLPGELDPGPWGVVLGLHHVPAEGLEVTLTITLDGPAVIEAEPTAPMPSQIARGSARALPALPGLTWLAGDLHAHTLHSDGSLSIRQLAARAAAAGLDVLAVTDHNTTSHHRHLPAAGAEYGIHLLPGQEVTTSRGHANVYGDIGWIDFRKQPDIWFATVEARGGVASVNHPLDADCAWQHPLAAKPTCLEIMHSSWLVDRTWTGPWALWWNWGLEVTPIGGSDFHTPDQSQELGVPTTWLAVEEVSNEGILDALRACRTALATGPRAPVLLRLGDDLLAIDAGGTTLIDRDGRSRIVHGDRARFAADTVAAVAGVPGAGHSPYRLETDSREILAITA
jgi:hypothetical protein